MTQLSPDEVLARAYVAGQTRQYRIARPHVPIRMAERGATMKCISKALQTAKQATYQFEKDRWRLSGGVDIDGDELELAIAVHHEIVVVTLF